MPYPSNSFQTYAQLKGIELLRDDVKFIKAALAKVPYNSRRSVLERFSEQWLLGMAKCDIVYRRQNLGRRRANIWLREFIDDRHIQKRIQID
jgi:hypothetical protein